MKGCLRSVVIFLVLVAIINRVMNLVDEVLINPPPAAYEPDCTEYSEDIPNTNVRRHQRFWGFQEQANNHCLVYDSRYEISRENEQVRLAELRPGTSENFWGGIYDDLVSQTNDQLDFLADSLFLTARKLSYSRLDLARLVVSFVQDIPYSYVVPVDCDEIPREGQPCIGNIPYGIVSPYEFAHDHHGDCDTRAVLLYVLLTKLEYEPMIVVSDEYTHAMLALNVPAQGDHLNFGGRKYYFWETTATGWSIGMLPPDVNNIDYWKIALVNES